MKAILEFNLDNEDDRMSHMRCIKSADMASFIWELEANFWRKWKHNEDNFTLDSYREALSELMEHHNISSQDLNS